MADLEFLMPGEWDFCSGCNKPTAYTEGTIHTYEGEQIAFTCDRCDGLVP